MKKLIIFLFFISFSFQQKQSKFSDQFLSNIKELHRVKDGYNVKQHEEISKIKSQDLQRTFSILIGCKNQNCEKQRRQFYRELVSSMYKRQGIIGEQGLKGANGIQGPVGIVGEKGDQGDQGDQGDPGDNAKIDNELIKQYQQKLQGPTGDKGDQGDQGEQGPEGEQGERGDTGPTGKRGKDGKNGKSGKQGEQGDQGDQGDEGDRGDTGDRGEQGDQGDQGDQGEQGDEGDQGFDGDQGKQGEKGDKGPDGLSISKQTVENIARSVVWSIFGKIQNIHQMQRPIILFDSYRILQLDDRCLAQYGAFGVACEMSSSKCNSCECANSIEALKCCLMSNRPLFYNTTSNITEEVKEQLSIWDIMELDPQEKQIKKMLIIKTDECIKNGIAKTFQCDSKTIINILMENIEKNLKNKNVTNIKFRFKQTKNMEQQKEYLQEIKKKYQFTKFLINNNGKQVTDLQDMIDANRYQEALKNQNINSNQTETEEESIQKKRFRMAIQKSFIANNNKK